MDEKGGGTYETKNIIAPFIILHYINPMASCFTNRETNDVFSGPPEQIV